MRTLVSLAAALTTSIGLMLTISAAARAQPPVGEILSGIQRLGVTGSVLYVAAHPDDENSRLLAYLVGARGVRTAYLSMTRGDGGQNLIGTEQDELLGLIRTHELLAARRIDGAEQLFTRARDFGYSKTPDETLRIWGKDAVLSDVVLAIRRYQPDVVITRFNLKPPNHGHHTASAILAEEAFTAAANPTRFPEQLTDVKPWKTNRLLHNVSTWNLAPNADLSPYIKLDDGGFDPLLGRSFGEVAAASRSQHKSQGFGVASERGQSFDYFSSIGGANPKSDIFEGLDLTWHRYPATEKLVVAIKSAVDGFSVGAPEKSIPALIRIHDLISALPDDNPFKAIKLREAESLISSCAGLYFEAAASEPTAVPGAPVSLNIFALNRSTVPIKLVSLNTPDSVVAQGRDLVGNIPVKLTLPWSLPSDAPISTPYWLRNPVDGGLYDVTDRALIGRPEADPPLSISFTYEVGGKRITTKRAVIHTWTDPVRGELTRLFEVAPAVTATMDRGFIMFPNNTVQPVSVVLVAGKADASGSVKLEAPTGWQVEPASIPFQFTARGDEKTVRFQVTPPKTTHDRGKLRAIVDVGGRTESWRVRHINHEHIPPQSVRQPSEATLVPFSLASKVHRLGYIPGPGDRVAESLSFVGYDVTILSDDRLASDPLDRFEAIVVGVRAFNSNPRLAIQREKLMQYVEKGGRLIVQYNTNSRLGPLTVNVGPYPLEIGRDRVTDETATMNAVDAKDSIWSTPNQLTPADFEGWVQERGLYFATKWDDHYRPVFSIQDPGEDPSKGALLVAKHGKGTFVYTGLAFFRQLPSGVPGAYRLMANILAQ